MGWQECADQDGSVHETRLLGGEEQVRRSNFLRTAQTSYWRALDHVREHFLGDGQRHLRLDESPDAL